MAIDFTLLLTTLTLLSGLIIAIDRLFFYPKRKERVLLVEFSELKKLAKQKIDKAELKKIRDKAEPWLVDTARSFFPILFIVLIIRSFFIEPYQIPSGSMLPTLRIGDFILVNKYTYGVRLPVLNTKVLDGRTPARGEVLVFRAPFDPKVNYIKRVIGIPGDTVELKDNALYINREKIAQGMIKTPDGAEGTVFTETINDKSHYIHPLPLDQKGEYSWVVPEGGFFVMGDNRPNSYDSRFWNFVPEENIVGKAFYVWMYWPELLSIPGFGRTGSIDKNLDG